MTMKLSVIVIKIGETTTLVQIIIFVLLYSADKFVIVLTLFDRNTNTIEIKVQSSAVTMMHTTLQWLKQNI